MLIQDSKLIKGLREFKLIILHLIISALIWQLPPAFISSKYYAIFNVVTIDIRLIFIIIINFLIILTRIKYSQINGTIPLKYKRADFLEIKIHKLKQFDKGEKLEMTWETLGKGLEHLKKND